MPDRFPTAPRTPRSVRLGAIAIGALALAIGIRTTITSLDWIYQLSTSVAV